MEPSSSWVSCSAERFGDPLRDHRRQVLFEDAFDQDSRGHVAGTGVDELLARLPRWRELQLQGQGLVGGVRPHQVFVKEKVPRAEAGGVTEQHGEGDLVGVRELGKPGFDGLVERQSALVNELQRDGGDEGLGDARRAVGAVGRHGRLGLAAVDARSEVYVVVARHPQRQGRAVCGHVGTPLVEEHLQRRLVHLNGVGLALDCG